MVWFHLDGVTNICLQHRMVVNSGWRVYYRTDRVYKTGDPCDLSYDCEMLEGVKLCLITTEQVLYVLNCAKYFSLNKL